MLCTWANQIPSCADELRALTRPGARPAPWGVRSGHRVGVALSYLTPGRGWHTIWRTLANRGE
ncbi:hypothetical protein ACFPK5_39085 [Streptomyces beijiangensis]|uniref:hypothetical protein n=1 Tax=Streptomyces beijiangensis TaxID=163361 RepID=UPI0033716F37